MGSAIRSQTTPRLREPLVRTGSPDRRLDRYFHLLQFFHPRHQRAAQAVTGWPRSLSARHRGPPPDGAIFFFFTAKFVRRALDWATAINGAERAVADAASMCTVRRRARRWRCPTQVMPKP